MYRLLILLVCCFSVCVSAKTLTPEQVPEPLKPWLSWVATEMPEKNCPFLFNSYEQKRCQLPTQSSLSLHDKGGTFSSTWRVYAAGWIALVGDDQHWPQQVRLNTKDTVVMDKNGIPSVWVTAGLQTLTGVFFWDELPDSVRLPEDMALISLQINAVNAPVTLRDGQLWLKNSQPLKQNSKVQQNSVAVRVFRKISDDVPVQVLTRLVLDVSGEAREIKLTSVILPELIPLALHSPLPARLEANGQLAVQVRAGQWQIDLTARSSKDVAQLTLANAVTLADTTNTEQTPAELWVFAAQTALRLLEIEQLATIDASQTDLPEAWQILPAYRINAGQAMRFKLIRRGDSTPEPNQLRLNRVLWLDFDGAAYSVNDTIAGMMSRGWRLNALPETKLGKVALDGANQLITLENVTEHQGVEVRKGMIALNADSRIIGDITRLNAVGWQHTFHQVNTELNLPPGWHLLAASGVDNVPNSSLSQWTLLDLFLVLITALAIGRLWHYYWAVLALVTLTLIWHEADAPHYIWLNILAALALLRVLPSSHFYKLIRWYRNTCWLALILMLLPFMLAQIRLGIYPHLAQAKPLLSSKPDLAGGTASNGVMSYNAVVPQSKEEKKYYRTMNKDTPPSSLITEEARYEAAKTDRMERFDPKAKVQTGAGLPQWQWHKVYLSWHGAVTAEQQVRLWYLTPTVSMLLNFLRVILTTLLALLLLGVAEKFKLSCLIPTIKSPPSVCLLLLLPVLLLITPPVHADNWQGHFSEYPSNALLETLEQRLQEQTVPDCLPSCAQIQQMQLQIDAHLLTLSLTIHAQENVVLPLPAATNQWFPNQVVDNDKTATGLYRSDDKLWINLSAGTHDVVLRGATPLLKQFSLPLIVKPKRVTLEKSAWEVVGVHENGLVDDSLQFKRLASSVSNNNKPLLTPNTLPALMRVERDLSIGLNWRVITHITRLSPANSAVVLTVPLLAGEAVISEGVRVQQQAVQVNMSAQQQHFFWQSTLEPSKQLDLVAPPTEQWVEVWRADVSPLWHVNATGIPMIYLNRAEQWSLEWHPWAGESVSLQLTRPSASQGKTLTIDSSQLRITQGQRTRESMLIASVRSSQGTQHTITLPEQALLQSVAINGQHQALRAIGRHLTIPISPTSQTVAIIWQETAPISPVLSTSIVDLGQESVNNTLSVSLGQDRWLLFAKGTSFGPVILFWSVLLVIFIVSLALGKVSLTPLKTGHWFLLLVGLSQVPLAAATIVIVWLILLGWRGEQTIENRHFNLIQSTLVICTLLSLAVLFSAIAQGLLGAPDMLVTGNQSSATVLNWYIDRSAAQLPTATIISLPLISYRLLMLAWSLWLAVFLLDWLKWGWHCFSNHGLWRKKEIKHQISQDL